MVIYNFKTNYWMCFVLTGKWNILFLFPQSLQNTSPLCSTNFGNVDLYEHIKKDMNTMRWNHEAIGY